MAAVCASCMQGRGLPALLAQAQTEAGAAFSSGDVYMEKFVGAPRHIEFQVLADEHGNVEILGERECSVSSGVTRNCSKNRPRPSLRAAVRERVSDSLRKAMKAIGYSNAGTVEFLMDENGELYFIEVNARIQVEHPVTEFVTGIDLVKAQIRIAAGETLPTFLRGPVIRGPRHRVPHQRRESGNLRALAGPITGLESAGRHRRSRRYRGLSPTA